jgi:predicted DNA-binding transcriptional regulator
MKIILITAVALGLTAVGCAKQKVLEYDLLAINVSKVRIESIQVSLDGSKRGASFGILVHGGVSVRSVTSQ